MKNRVFGGGGGEGVVLLGFGVVHKRGRLGGGGGKEGEKNKKNKCG